MRIKILRSFCLRPGLDVTPGEVVEATRLEALEALSLRRAERVQLDAPSVETEPAPAAPAEKRKWGRK